MALLGGLSKILKATGSAKSRLLGVPLLRIRRPSNPGRNIETNAIFRPRDHSASPTSNGANLSLLMEVKGFLAYE